MPKIPLDDASQTHRKESTVPNEDIFAAADTLEQTNPGVAEAMKRFGASMEAYEASLSAVYAPTVVTSGSTEDLLAYVE